MILTQRASVLRSFFRAYKNYDLQVVKQMYVKLKLRMGSNPKTLMRKWCFGCCIIHKVDVKVAALLGNQL